jgi:hypothetical protein
VTPVRNGIKAPYMILEAEYSEEAIKEAKSKSKLSDFKSWKFTVKEIKSPQPKNNPKTKQNNNQI